jgi:hypothetical protein
VPIGQAPGLDTYDKKRVIYADAVAAEPLSIGHAVAIVSVAGNKRVYRCGASTYAELFTGFSDTNAAVGSKLLIVVGRGSRVIPFVEGGGLLTENARVFLSATPGEVTQTPMPRGPGVFVVAVGEAISPTEIDLLTDYKIKTP